MVLFDLLWTGCLEAKAEAVHSLGFLDASCDDYRHVFDVSILCQNRALADVLVLVLGGGVPCPMALSSSLSSFARLNASFVMLD